MTEEKLKKPVVVTDYPKDVKAFYMRANDDGRTVRAMDVLVPRIGEIYTKCTHENTTDRVVTFGESTDTEMCISAFYRFPAQSSSSCARTAKIDTVP